MLEVLERCESASVVEVEIESFPSAADFFVQHFTKYSKRIRHIIFIQNDEQFVDLNAVRQCFFEACVYSVQMSRRVVRIHGWTGS
jgi:hypothetical protein